MDPLAQFLGESPGVAALRDQIRRLLQRQPDARRLPPVLIQGETGTGKGLVARLMRSASGRARSPFVDVNCAAIPETLLEAELFGFERGAFTDARQAKPGLFQLAHRGTIFLDEIGLLPEALQPKLLKVIEEGAVRRLGGVRSEPLDVWVITATNEDLAAAVRARRFRADLYHRVAVVTFSVPPLRDRGDDLLTLAEHFLARACADYGLPPRTLGAAARAVLAAYPWPGNVRELANVMERVALLSDDPIVTPEVLGLPTGVEVGRRAAGEVPPLESVVGAVEREHLLRALQETGWNVTRAALRLGISRNTLRYRMDKHGLGSPTFLESGAVAPRPRRRAPPREPAPPPTPLVATARTRRRLTLLGARLVDTGPVVPAVRRRLLDLAQDKARSFGGRLEDLTTSGLVAVFGVEPVEDAPLRAAHAAMAIVNAVTRAGQAESVGINVGCAIHVDQFVVGAETGPVIDLDARPHAWGFLESMLAAAEPGSVVVSDAAVPFLERRFELLPAPSKVPTHVWRLGGRERVGLGAAFVGREHELGLLRSRFESATRGPGQVIGIVGEAGIGKSRLLLEFRRGLGEQPIACVEGHCLSYGSAMAYLPVLDIVRGLGGIAEADPPEVAADRLRRALAEAGLNAVEAAPYLLHLLGFKDGTERLAPLDPEEIKTRVLEILRQLMLRQSRRRPLVVVVEDLHWIDRASEESLAALVDAVPTARILLITTYRSGYRPPWIDRSHVTQIALPGLDRASSLQVVRAVLGGQPVDDTVIERILARAEGNPFFLEELARAVREQGGAPTAAGVPETIQEVLLARLDRLEEGDRKLLQAAAVVGKTASTTLLGAVADQAEEGVRAALRRLRAAGFLYDSSFGQETEHTFKHMLTHEVAYQSLPDDERRQLHAAIVGALERLHPERLDELVDRLGHHALHGGLWEPALRYLRQAGRKATARSAYREAVARFEQALEALGRLPEGRERSEQAIDLRLELRNAFIPLGDVGPILARLAEAEALARALDDRRRLGWVACYTHACHWVTGDYPRALDYARQAQRLGSELDERALLVYANSALAWTYHSLGEYREAIASAAWVVDALRGELVWERFGIPSLPAVVARAWMALCLAERGEFARGITCGEEALSLAERADNPWSVVSACLGLGGLRLRKGDLEDAGILLEHGLDVCRRFTIEVWFPPLASALGYARALSGRLGEGITLLEEAIERARGRGWRFSYAIAHVWLGEAYLLASRPDEAGRRAAAALALARESREAGHEAYGLRLLAEIAARSDPGDIGPAREAYARALGLATGLEMRPLVGRCRLGLGQLSARAGRWPEAREHLGAARVLFEDLGMRAWVARADAALSDLSTP